LASSSSSPASPHTEAPAITGLVCGNGRDKEIVSFEHDVVSFFIEAADVLGVPKSVAAIYAICFATAEPLSFADIEKRLNISRGSISQGLRVLREVGALREVSASTDRCERFQPELGLRKLVERWLDNRLQKQLSAGQSRLQALARSVPASRTSNGRILRDRLKVLQAWQDRTRSLLPLVKTFLKVT
jgi:DNA-binding transcriptional regulator GbsR (MarR family)